MKTYKIVFLLPLLIAFSSFAQTTKTEKIPVAGNCGMCEKKIETAAKEAGAAKAEWNKDTKVLIVKYNSATTNAAKIQQAIASVGYDTRDFKATDESYNKLHACCQYDRTEALGKQPGAQKEEAMDCCKDGKCSKPGHNGKDCCKKS